MNLAQQTRFRIAVHRLKQGYLARALDIPGCYSCGATEVEAVENARASIRSYVRLVRALSSVKPTVELEIGA
jgi:predicted RNase H-like HicB family nuclease